VFRKTRRVPNQPKTPQRAIRIPDDLWQAAKSIARDRGETLSEVIRDALAEYVRRHRKT
jgi:predicted transcriptional regulator